MVEIIPIAKLKIDSLAHRDNEQLLVCVRDAKGRLLFITEFTRYLEERCEGADE